MRAVVATLAITSLGAVVSQARADQTASNIERVVPERMEPTGIAPATIAPVPPKLSPWGDAVNHVQLYDPDHVPKPVEQPAIKVFKPGAPASTEPQPETPSSQPSVSTTVPSGTPDTRKVAAALLIALPLAVAPAVPQAVLLRARQQDTTFSDVVAVGSDTRFYCTGVLVAADAVLTARHCGHPTRVGFGSYASAPLLVLAVRAEVTPDDGADVLLLRLVSPAPFPPRLRRRAADDAPPKDLLRAIGFGSTVASGRAGFGTKRQLDLPVAGWGCDGQRPVMTSCDPASEMVIVSVGGRDTCDGDSGGPVLEHYGATWRLVGITSRPIPGGIARCGGGGIYVRLDKLDAWLTGALGTTQGGAK